MVFNEVNFQVHSYTFQDRNQTCFMLINYSFYIAGYQET